MGRRLGGGGEEVRGGAGMVGTSLRCEQKYWLMT